MTAQQLDMQPDTDAQPDPDAPQPLSPEELRSILETEIRQAINSDDSQIAQDQQIALEYYEGRPFGNEVEGSSQVVLRDVAEVIDWALPAMLRAIFFTSEVVRYEDTTPDSEAAGYGRRMSQVINEIFRQQLRGFPVTYNWAKAGLLERFSTVKFWIEQVREPILPPQSAEGLSAEQLVLMSQRPDIELTHATARDLPVLDFATGKQAQVYDVQWRQWRTFPRMRLETVPPEEFLCCRDATRLDQQIRFVAHRKLVTRSELQALGIPWEDVAKIPATSGPALDARKTTREQSDSSELWGWDARRDKASQRVTFIESYMRVDYDGDGYAELRRIWSAGDGPQTILDHDYAPMHGFAGWTPIPMPHKLYGRGFADIVGDLQQIRSTLARQLLDNIYRMNNARHKIIVGEVDLDSYLDTAPGAPIEVDRMESIEALETPALPSWSFDALSYFEKVREQRTGIHPYAQDVYAAGQNQTAQGVSQVFEAAMAQIQLLCQIFAETGLRDLFTIIPRAMKAAGMGAGKIKVGDEWITYNPQEWPDEIRVSVQVGLSPGQTEQRIQRLLLLLGLQKEALSNFGPGYMVTPDQLFATAVRIVEQAGFQNAGAFFTSPEGKQMPQQPPSPEEVKAQSDAQDKQSQAALQLAQFEFEKEKEAKQTARLQSEAIMEHERELARIAAQERTQRYAIDRQFEASLRQSQVALVDGGSKAEGAPSGPSPMPILNSLTERVAEVDGSAPEDA